MVPYTVREPFRVDRSKTWVDKTFTLSPNYNKTYYLDSVIKNTSIFQIDIESSDSILFRIINDDENVLVFEWQRGEPSSGPCRLEDMTFGVLFSITPLLHP